MLRITGLALLAASLGFAATGVLAQSYPNKPIRIIVSYPPGGGADFLTRLVAEKLHEKWGQPVVVDNRAGGMGIIGVQAAAAAKPDGYTLLVGSSNHLISLPSMYDNLPYDTVKDFVPVAPVANQPFVLVVQPSVPAQSVKELIALAKSKPGELNFGSTGSGTVDHLGGELLQIMTGIKMEHIPYKGSGPLMTALLSAGQVTMAFTTVIPSTPHIKSGKLRALVIAAPNRSAALPDVPTTAETGLPDLLIYSWNGVFAPAGTPREIVNQLNREIVSFIRMTDVIKRLSVVGAEPMSSTPEQYSTLVKEDLEKWGKIIKAAGIEKQRI